MLTNKENINKEKLHNLLLEYNWNDGFDLPRAIVNNPECDLGTAIMCFDLADGYTYLVDFEELQNSRPKSEWFAFVDSLFHRIKEKDFKTSEIHFEPGLTRVQKFQLKKIMPNIPTELLNGIEDGSLK